MKGPHTISTHPRLFVTSWSFGLAWVVASTLGAAIGLALSVGAMAAIGGDDDRLAIILLPSVGGGILVMQWLTLRRRVPQAARWVVATLAGGLIGALGVVAVSWGIGAILGSSPAVQHLQGAPGNIVALSLYGLGLGVMQWCFLRRHWASAGWWVLASVVGWAGLGLVIGSGLESLAELVWFGPVPAAVTGCALIYLLKERVSDMASEGQKAI